MRGIKNVRLTMTHAYHSLFSSPFPSILPSLPAVFLRPISAATMSFSGTGAEAGDSSTIQQKRALRLEIRRALRAFSPAQRSLEDAAIQNLVLESAWFKSCTRLCAYISCEALREVDTSRILSEILSNQDGVSSKDHHTHVKKKLYVPRVEDKNSHMRMFYISSTQDLVANSMNILEPAPIYADGSPREDVMLASYPVDLFLLPGVAFDRSGRRLGRGGGYYDVFLSKYQELAMERRWKQPLLVALAYSVQIMEENVIPVTPTDVHVDALVCPSGVIPISPAAHGRM